MGDGGYRRGGTVGGKWGCAAAVIFALPLFIVLLMAEALGYCPPDTGCHKGFWPNVILPPALVAIVAGISVRWIVNRLRRGRS